MTESAKVNVGTPPPHVQLMQMGMGALRARVVYLAAKLRLADLLAEGPKSAAQLAGPTGTHEHSLHRLLRTLSSLGVFAEGADGSFGLTEIGEALKTGAPGGGLATILTFGSWVWKTVDELEYSVETGKSAFAKVYGMEFFPWIMSEPEAAAQFSGMMIGMNGGEPPAIAAAYDFSSFETVVDIGGSTGNMLVHVLGRHSRPRGILFDLPASLAGGSAFLAKHGMEGRVAIEAGSFFEGVPTGADCYILSHIIHDWPEEQNLTILGNCRRAMKPESKLLIVEFVLPPGNTPHPGKLLDMMMLAVTGGEERTEAEFATLLAKAGLRMTRVVPTSSAASIVEAVVV